MQITKENLTIIIVTIKSQNIIDDCLKSIDPDIKKIIVENSSDQEFINSLKAKYKEEYAFIHVEIYDDPEQVQLNFEGAKISDVVKQWRLPTSLWTFIISEKGEIEYRFEAFASKSEIENALNEI